MATRKLLSIGTDRLLFKEGSAVRIRQIEYAKKYEEVHIIVFSDKNFIEQSISPNCWVYPTKSSFKFMAPFDAMRLGRFIAKGRGITEITCQDSSFTAMAGLALKKEFNIPLEIQIHEDISSPHFGYSMKSRMRKSMALSYIPKADSVRVVSNRIKNFLVDTLNVPEQKITVRPILVDVESIKSAPILETADLRKKYPQFKKIVLMASRLEKEKNIKMGIMAWSQVVSSSPEAGLIIVGSGSMKSELESLVKKMNLQSSVVFENWADKSTLVSYYKTADVFLSTSLFEGYGMTLVEAQAAGCVIVSTAVGVAEEVGAHIVGWDTEEIAEEINQVLESLLQ
ncbi:MAG: glycosyltransferase family 4 protein [bacterium]|nr:glycosyltransferase family 4 protein [bacterium]